MKKALTLIVLLIVASITITAQEITECEEGLRLFDHEYLATDPLCIPEDPQRIIAIDESVMADFIALGVEPIGVHDWGARDFTAYLDTTSVASVGTREGPNLEAMLELDPDLIVGRAQDMEWYGDDFLQNLQRIAPVVLSNNDDTTWENDFLLRGAVVNREELAQQLLDAYEDRLTEFRDLTSDLNSTIAIIRSRADAFNIYVGDYFIVDLIEDAGLRFPEAFNDLPTPNSISLEEIDMLNSDYLFVMVRNEDEAGYFEQAIDSPLWSFLPAVQQEHVYQVNWSTWVAGWNIVGAHLVVDDLFTYFTGTVSTTPNPFAELVTEDYAPEQPADATTGSPVGQDAAACEEGYRLFNHELLATDPVCVPANPERVVALDPFAYELLILNGTPPVGAIGYLEPVYRNNFPYLAEDIAAIEYVGFPANVEAILALNPDLIIGSFLDDALITQLAEIAPTVSYSTAGSGDWKRPMQMVGELLGLSELVDALFAQYETRLADLRAAVEDPSAIEVSIIRVQPDRIMLNLVNSFPAVVVTDAGFGRPESQAYSQEEAIEVYGGAIGAFISVEEIQLADGDYIFAWSNQASDEENAAADENWRAVESSPLWNTLTAAQNETAYRVGGHWLGWGIFAAHGIIDDLFIHIAGVDPSEASPNPFLMAETTLEETGEATE